MLKYITFTLFCALSLPSSAIGDYQSSEQFIAQAFKQQNVAPKVLWLTTDDKAQIAEIMSHRFNLLRIRYWQHNNETVWVLNEIGKEKPITIAVHIKNSAIANLKVLTYRESRGDEVRHQFFTKQFTDAQLTPDNKLTQHIDGITGATMSVHALTKVARVALWLNKKVQP